VTAERNRADQRSDYAEPRLSTIEEFPLAITSMLEQHRPSRMPFFDRSQRCLAPPRVTRSSRPDTSDLPIGHDATRAAVYYLPAPRQARPLRKRKLRIFIDDDGLSGAIPITIS